MKNYTVTVGNLGSFSFYDYDDALICYQSYVRDSQSGAGWIAGQDVALLDAETLDVILEHIGSVL